MRLAGFQRKSDGDERCFAVRRFRRGGRGFVLLRPNEHAATDDTAGCLLALRLQLARRHFFITVC